MEPLGDAGSPALPLHWMIYQQRGRCSGRSQGDCGGRVFLVAKRCAAGDILSTFLASEGHSWSFNLGKCLWRTFHWWCFGTGQYPSEIARWNHNHRWLQYSGHRVQERKRFPYIRSGFDVVASKSDWSLVMTVATFPSRISSRSSWKAGRSEFVPL